MPAVRVLLISIGAVILLIIIVVVFTVATSITEDKVRLWFDAVGGIVSAAAAIVVALLGFRAQRLQALDAATSQRLAEESARKQAIEAQHAQSEETRRTLLTERLWRERRPVYARLLSMLDADSEMLVDFTEFRADLNAVGSREVNAAVERWVQIQTLLKRPDLRPPEGPAEEELLRQLDEAADSIRDLVRRELGADVPLTNEPEQA